MKIRSLLAVVALCGSLTLAACTQEASQGSSGNPYGSSSKPSDTGGSMSGGGGMGGGGAMGGGMR